jgi:hypothetical protein
MCKKKPDLNHEKKIEWKNQSRRKKEDIWKEKRKPLRIVINVRMAKERGLHEFPEFVGWFFISDILHIHMGQVRGGRLYCKEEEENIKLNHKVK